VPMMAGQKGIIMGNPYQPICKRNERMANAPKKEAAPEAEIQERPQPAKYLTNSEFARKREYLSILLFTASPDKQRKILKEMNIRRRH